MNGNNEGTGVYNTPSRSLQHVWRSDASSVSVLSTCRPSRLTPAMIVTDLEAQMLEVNCLLLRNVYLIHVMEIRFETIIILMIFGHCSVRKIFVWVMLTGGLEKKISCHHHHRHRRSPCLHQRSHSRCCRRRRRAGRSVAGRACTAGQEIHFLPRLSSDVGSCFRGPAYSSGWHGASQPLLPLAAGVT